MKRISCLLFLICIVLNAYAEQFTFVDLYTTDQVQSIIDERDKYYELLERSQEQISVYEDVLADLRRENEKLEKQNNLLKGTLCATVALVLIGGIVYGTCSYCNSRRISSCSAR